MKSMKIYPKLITAFLIVIALSLAIGIVGMVMTGIVSGMATKLYEEDIKGLEVITDMQENITKIRVDVNRMALYAAINDQTELSNAKAAYAASVNGLSANVGKFKNLNLMEQEQKEADKFDGVIAEYNKACDAYHAALNASAGNAGRVIAALDVMSGQSGQLEKWMADMTAAKEAEAEVTKNHSDRLSALAMVMEITLIVIIIAFSMIIAVFIATGIEKNLKNIIKTLSMSTMNLSSSATELTAASESLATGSSKQAAAIEETSATMNETSSMVAQNAENTRVAAQIVVVALNEVNEAGKVMTELMGTMSELKESSDKVGKIVKTIDDIAFQTNLLAINATVEAARAGGDAGRSFAVVAQEVRSLAQRSADSSRETAEIIEKNITLTDTSRSGAEQVMKIAGANAKNIGDLNKLISEINAASEEQASGIRQINIAMSQMEKVTQENAAVAEENAASSGSMKDEITHLEDAIAIAGSLVRNADQQHKIK